MSFIDVGGLARVALANLNTFESKEEIYNEA